MPPLFALTEDPALAISDLDATVRTVPGEWQDLVDEVTLTWTPPPESTGLRCIAVYTKRPGSDYPAFVELYPFLGSGVIVFPGAEPGTYCYKLVALATDRHGPPTEVCVEIQHSLRPRPPAAGPTPPATLPAVTDLKVVVLADILYPDGTFKRPEERNNRVAVTWTSTGFEGAYEVRRAVGEALERNEFELVAIVDGSSSSADGTITFEEGIAFWFPETCYRVRAVLGAETGPEAETCTIPPPPSGPGAPPSVTPGPPDAGSGQGSGSSTDAALALAALVMSGFAASMWAAARRRR